jgi:hypothetical protein
MMERGGWSIPKCLTSSGRAFYEPFEPFMNQFVARLAYFWLIGFASGL